MNNFFKTILSGLKTWAGQEINKAIKKSKADWNQNDPSADNYIKNRTHWEEAKVVTFVNNLTSEKYNNGDYPACTFVVGDKYDVIWNGQLYSQLECVQDGDYRVLGNSDQLPFYIDDDGGNALYIDSNEEGDWKVSISGMGKKIHTLDVKYLPEEHANLPAVVTTKMDIENPTGSGSFSMNRKAGTSIGEFSSAEGFDTTAAGNYSKAEGYMTKVNAAHTHVQGKYNIDPDGRYSIIEEFDCTLGPFNNNTYYYSSSYTVDAATGYFMLPNGYKSVRFDSLNTLPRGVYIASYGFGTRSLYMLTNESVKSTSGNSTTYTHVTILSIVPTYDRLGHYAHIVGNGTSEEERSNAHTLDWEGNAWYAGDVYVGSDGGTSIDEGSKKLATEEFVHETIQSPVGLLLTDAISDAKYRVQIQNGYLTSTVDVEASLIDFTYENTADGTYTITSWKGTLNGKPSTEIYIPNVPGIKL